MEVSTGIAGAGGGGAAVVVVCIGGGLVGLCNGDKPDGLGAMAGFGGNFGLFKSAVEDDSADSCLSSSSNAGGGVGGLASTCVGLLTLGLATIIRTVPSAFLRTRAAVA